MDLKIKELKDKIHKKYLKINDKSKLSPQLLNTATSTTLKPKVKKIQVSKIKINIKKIVEKTINHKCKTK